MHFEKNGGGWERIPWRRDSWRALGAGVAEGRDRRRGSCNGERELDGEERRIEEEEEREMAVEPLCTEGHQPYCVIRAPAPLAPFCPRGTAPRFRWIPRTPPSLGPFCAPRALGWLVPYPWVQI
jgi:hypothetical protein